MPRGPLSAEAKTKISRAQKRRWAKQRAQNAAAHVGMAPATRNGMISIPCALATLLTARPEDYKDPRQYGDVQTLAQALLRVLLQAEQSA